MGSRPLLHRLGLDGAQGWKTKLHANHIPRKVRGVVRGVPQFLHLSSDSPTACFCLSSSLFRNRQLEWLVGFCF